MRIKNIYFLLIIIVLSAPGLRAQDTLKTDVIDVVKSFKPILSEAMKIQSNPNPEIPQVAAPVFTYPALPQNKYNVVPTIYTIKPLTMGTALLPKLKNNYLKLGYGNYNSPLIEAYVSSLRNKAVQYGVFAKHLSTNTNDNNILSSNALQLFSKKFTPKGVFAIDAAYQRDKVYLYGYDKKAPEPPSDKIGLLYQTYRLKGVYENIVKDSNALSYKVGADYRNTGLNSVLTENDFSLSGVIQKRIQNNPIEIATSVNITSVKTTPLEYQRVFVDINPRYTLLIGKELSLKVGFNATYFSDTNSSGKLYFYPVAEAAYKITPSGLTAFTGITGHLQKHTFHSITTENPFTVSPFFRNTLHQFEFFGGLKGKLGPQTSFLLRGSWAKVENMLFYAADSMQYYGQMAWYDTASSSVSQFKAELNHEFDSKFRLGLSFTYTGYSLKALDEPYSRPTVETAVHAAYAIGNKFILRSEIYTMNSRKALILQGNRKETMAGLVDINVGADYLYNKNISVFLNMNNITNNTYQRWFNYPVYGFMVMGGLNITF